MKAIKMREECLCCMGSGVVQDGLDETNFSSCLTCNGSGYHSYEKNLEDNGFTIELGDGKYSYVFENGKQYALRYGEFWKDLVGDKFTYAMACKIQDLEEEIKSLKKDMK